MEALKELRRQKKISQGKLAEDLHVTQATVSRWETGEMLPTIDYLNELSHYFSVSIDYLLGNEQKKKLVTKNDELSQEEKRLIELFRLVPLENRGMVADMIEAALKSQGLLK